MFKAGDRVAGLGTFSRRVYIGTYVRPERDGRTHLIRPGAGQGVLLGLVTVDTVSLLVEGAPQTNNTGCDCGAEKCRTLHAHWCSTQKGVA